MLKTFECFVLYRVKFCSVFLCVLWFKSDLFCVYLSGLGLSFSSDLLCIVLVIYSQFSAPLHTCLHSISHSSFVPFSEYSPRLASVCRHIFAVVRFIAGPSSQTLVWQNFSFSQFIWWFLGQGLSSFLN